MSPTVSLEVPAEHEALFRRLLALTEELDHLALDAPDGSVFDACEAAVLRGGRDVQRQALQDAVERRVRVAEKKGRRFVVPLLAKTTREVIQELRRAAADRLPSPPWGRGVGVRGVLVLFARNNDFSPHPNPSPPKGRGEKKSCRSPYREQIGRCPVVSPGIDARTEIIHHLFALSPAGVHHSQHPFDKTTPLRAVRTAARLPQQHPVPLAPLRLVVRWFDPLDFHKHPQPLLVPQQFLARSCRLPAAALFPALQRLLYRFAHRLHGLLQLLSRQFARAELMPQMKQRVAMSQQLLANGFARRSPVNHRLEVPTQLRPTPLQPRPPGWRPAAGSPCPLCRRRRPPSTRTPARRGGGAPS